jgi:hypothetical protein
MADIFGPARGLIIEPDHGHVPASTLQAAEYLIRQGDPARLRKWLAKHSASERTTILDHLERKERRHARAVA